MADEFAGVSQEDHDKLADAVLVYRNVTGKDLSSVLSGIPVAPEDETDPESVAQAAQDALEAQAEVTRRQEDAERESRRLKALQDAGLPPSAELPVDPPIVVSPPVVVPPVVTPPVTQPPVVTPPVTQPPVVVPPPVVTPPFEPPIEPEPVVTPPEPVPAPAPSAGGTARRAK